MTETNPPVVPMGPAMVAPFREVTHNINQFGEHWSWRCGVQWTRASEGWTSGACRYDHVVDSWDELVEQATAHLAKWHGITPVAAVPDTGQADEVLKLRWEVQQLQGVVQDQHRAIAAVRSLCADAMRLPTLEDSRPADDRVSPRAVLAALDRAGSVPDTGQVCTLCTSRGAPVCCCESPSPDTRQARESDEQCQDLCKHCGAAKDQWVHAGCPIVEVTAEPSAATVQAPDAADLAYARSEVDKWLASSDPYCILPTRTEHIPALLARLDELEGTR